MEAFSIYITMYLIRIKTSNNKPCYLTDAETGDPPRTLLVVNALCFSLEHEALTKIEELRKKYPDRSFSLEETF